MSQVTRKELFAILLARKGCSFASFDAEYNMDDKGKMRKTGNRFHGMGVRKLATTSVMVTFDYEKSMERRGDEASGKGNWSMAVTRDDGSLTPLSIHKADEGSDDPRAYLRCEFRKSASRFVFSDGTPLTDAETAELKAFIPTKEKRTVEFYTVSLPSVKRMTIDHEEYILAA